MNQPPPQLPPGFIAQWSTQYQRYFYVNQATGQSQWELPQPQFAQPPGPPPQLQSQPGGLAPYPQYQQDYAGQRPVTPQPLPGMLQQQPVTEAKKPGISTGLAVGGGALAGAAGVLAVQGIGNALSGPHLGYGGYGGGYGGGFGGPGFGGPGFGGPGFGPGGPGFGGPGFDGPNIFGSEQVIEHRDSEGNYTQITKEENFWGDTQETIIEEDRYGNVEETVITTDDGWF